MALIVKCDICKRQTSRTDMEVLNWQKVTIKPFDDEAKTQKWIRYDLCPHCAYQLKLDIAAKEKTEDYGMEAKKP